MERGGKKKTDKPDQPELPFPPDKELTGTERARLATLAQYGSAEDRDRLVQQVHKDATRPYDPNDPALKGAEDLPF